MMISLREFSFQKIGTELRPIALKSPFDGGDKVEANEQSKCKRKPDGVNIERKTAARCGGLGHVVSPFDCDEPSDCG
jgi:hypothetical protein